MNLRKKTLAKLRQHVQHLERVALESQMEAIGENGNVRVAGEVPPPTQESNPELDNEMGGHLKRAIPNNFEYDPHALKPLAKVSFALGVALGHAMTAHREFTRLKSATISPDGLIGGRGYVMSVKDVRTQLHDACEAISAVADTIHDEIHAPHWRPKLAELEEQDLESVERLVGEADKALEDPESEVDDEIEETERSGDRAEMEEDEVDAGGSEIPDGEDHPDSESAKTKTASVGDSKRELYLEFYKSGPLVKQAIDLQTELPISKLSLAGSDFRQLIKSRMEAKRASSSVPVQTEDGGPRVQHLDRGDVDQTGPFGSYNSEEPHSTHDQWSRDDGVGSDYIYTSEWENDVSKDATSAVPDSNSDPTRTEGYDFGIGYGAGNDAHGQGAGGYANPDSDGKGVFGPSTQLPKDPGAKTKEDGSDSTLMVELSVGRKVADRWKVANSKLPSDAQPGVARSDYYQGDKSMNQFNVVHGESEVPDSGPRNDSESNMDVQPGVGYRFEQGAQPYVKWDDSTHNMRPDVINQRDDEGPYVKKV